MPEGTGITVGDVQALGEKLQAFHDSLGGGQQALLEEILRDVVVRGTPDGVAVYGLTPRIAHLPHAHGGGGVIGGAEQFTVLFGADGHVRFVPGGGPGPVP